MAHLKFAFTKKEFDHSIQEDIMLEKGILQDIRTEETAHGVEAFTNQNLPQNLANVPGSELGFTKVYPALEKANTALTPTKFNIEEGAIAPAANVAAGEVVHAPAASIIASEPPPSQPPIIVEPPSGPPEIFEIPVPPTPPTAPPIVIIPPTTPVTTGQTIGLSATGDVLNTHENTSVTFTAAQLLANDVLGSSGGELRNIELVAVEHGTLVNNGDGSYTYTPAADFYGTDNFRYQLSDNTGSTVTANVAINVAQVNDFAPIAPPLAYTINENNTVLITSQDLLAHATDLDNLGDTNDGLSIAGVSYTGNQGTLHDNGNGTWIFTPNYNFTGELNLDFSVTDGQHVTPSNIDVTVNPASTDGTLTPITYTMEENSTTLITTQDLLAHAIYPNDIGQQLTVTNVSYTGNDGTLTDNHDGTWTFTSAHDFFGATQLNFDVTDGVIATEQNINVIVLHVDQPPVAPPVAYTANENNQIVISVSDLLANVTDPDNTLSQISVTDVIYTGPNGSLFNNGDGTWTFTPTQDFVGNVQLEFTVTDGTLFTPSNINLTFNPIDIAPTVTPLAYTINEDTTLTFTTQDLLAHATDVNPNAVLNVTNVAYTGNNGSLHDNGNGTWTFTPTSDFTGHLQLSFAITDGVLTTPQHIAVTVLPVDQPPVVTHLTYNIEEDGSLLITTHDLLAHAGDPDTPFNQLSVTNVTYTGSDGTLTANGNGTWTFVPTQSFTGNVQLSFGVSDGQFTTPQNIGVNVIPFNSTPADTPMSYTINENTGLLINDSTLVAHMDETGTAFTVRDVTYTGNAGTLSDNHNGTWTFIPNHNFNGFTQLSFDLSDGTTVLPNLINVTVLPVDQPPVAPVLNYTVTEDNTLLIRASDILNFTTDPDNTAAQLSISSLIYTGNEGSLQNNGDGTWTFTPAATFTGSLQLNFAVTDGTLFTPSTINVNVIPVDIAPVVIPVSYSVLENNSITITTQDLLAHATDVDTPFNQLSVTNVAYNGSDGILHDNGNGTWTFTPSQNFNGDLQLSFGVSDGTLTTPSNINVTVIPVDQAPIVTPVDYTINENNTLIITPATLLAHATDVDTLHGLLSVTNVSYVGNEGSLSTNPDGTWTFTPAENFNGNLQLNFGVTDGQLTTPQNINVTVLPVDQPPAAMPVAYTINENTSVVITTADLLAHANDLGNTPPNELQIVNVSYTGTNGSLINNGNGTWTFTGNNDFYGNVQLNYAVTDGTLFANSNVNINVLHIDQAPVVPPVAYNIDENHSVLISASDLLASVTDVDNTLNQESITAVTYTGNNGNLINNGNGTWTFTPNNDYFGPVQLNFGVSDGTLTTASTVNITVNHVDQPPVTAPIAVTTAEDTPIIITAAQLLGNSYDVDSSVITPINVTSTHGTIVANNDGTWTYTPDPNFSGPASLSFSVTDGQLSTPSSGVINVTPINDALTVNPESYTTNENTPLTFTAEQLLSGATDLSFPTADLSVMDVTYTGSNGSLTDNQDGTYTFTPGNNFYGNLQMQFSVTDGVNVTGQNINVTVSY